MERIANAHPFPSFLLCRQYHNILGVAKNKNEGIAPRLRRGSTFLALFVAATVLSRDDSGPRLGPLFLSCLGAGIAGFLLRPCFVTGYLLKRGLFFALKLSGAVGVIRNFPVSEITSVIASTFSFRYFNMFLRIDRALYDVNPTPYVECDGNTKLWMPRAPLERADGSI